jgi:hypothetical protein
MNNAKRASELADRLIELEDPHSDIAIEEALNEAEARGYQAGYKAAKEETNDKTEVRVAHSKD